MSSNHVVALFDGVVYKSPVIENDSELRVEVETKRYRHQFEIYINELQQDKKLDGFILADNVVYKVFANGSITKKISGNEAKSIKRIFKLESK